MEMENDTWISWLLAGSVMKVSLAWKLRWAMSLERQRFNFFLAILLLMPAFRKSRVMEPVINEMINHGKFREATEVVDVVFDDWFRREGYFGRIAEKAAEAGDFTHAEIAADMIPADDSPFSRDQANMKIIEFVAKRTGALADHGSAEIWRLFAKITPGIWQESAALHYITDMWLSAGDFDQAFRVAVGIPEFSRRNGALCSVGLVYLKQSLLNDVERVLRFMRGETRHLFRQSFWTLEDFHQRFLDSWPSYASDHWNIFEMGHDVGACAIAAMEIDSLAMALIGAIIEHHPKRAFRLARTFVADRREVALFFYQHGLIQEAIDLHPPTYYSWDEVNYPEICEAVSAKIREKLAA